MSTPRLRIGQLLVDAKLITAESLEEVLALQRKDGRRLGALLVEQKLINETQLTQILSHQLAVPWVALTHVEFTRELLNLVPRDVADRFCLVPIYVRHVRGQGNTLYVAMEDPSNEEGLSACREHAGLPARAMIAPPSDIRSALRAYYGIGPAPVAAAPVSTPPPAPVAVAPAIEPAPEPVPEPAPASLPKPVLELVATPDEQVDAPSIEAVEISLPSERLRSILGPPITPPPPSSERTVEALPRPRGRTPKMVSLTLLDGTTINLPARRRPRPVEALVAAEDEGPESLPKPPVRSEPPGPDDVQGLTARDLILALRVVGHGADASEVLGNNIRWESLFSALLSLMLKKHLIADWEFVDELKKQL